MLTSRPPIVTIMGHVDHGKTSLLDAIRHTHVTDGEHGGITQHIGAYQIEHKGQLITFIDTPGHAAFIKMRERGAQVTDVIVLVVAADDGVKPQTIESIKHIHDAKVPVIVAINKIDVAGASPDMVKAQLTEHQIFCEGYGGQTPAVNVSALKGEGIDELLETIILISQLEELKADPDAPLKAITIESSQDKHRGALGTLIVQEGTLKPTQIVYLDKEPIKVRALIDEYQKNVTAAPPGKPVQMMGFNTVPPVGSIITAAPVTKEAIETTAVIPEEAGKKAKQLQLILKADTAGTLEAIKNSFSSEVILIDSGIGPINESDVLLAKNTSCFILGFNVSILPSAKKLAAIDKVTIQTFKIIYDLLEFIEAKVLKLIEPTIDELELGTAEVIAVFNIKEEKIAGCSVKSGEIRPEHPLHWSRKGVEKGDLRIKSLKRGKEDIPTAKSGSECGIVFKQGQIDFRVGDMLKSYKKIEEVI